MILEVDVEAFAVDLEEVKEEIATGQVEIKKEEIASYDSPRILLFDEFYDPER